MISAPVKTEEISERLGLSRNQAAILSAYVDLIEELGTDDVSYRLIARRAGVGERTVFRQYSTRQELSLATAAWLEHVVFVRPTYGSIFDVPVGIRQTMEAYQRHPELAHVAAETMMRGVHGTGPAPQAEHFEELLHREIPGLDEQERRTVVIQLAHLDSASTWAMYRREFGMEAHDIADGAAWSAEALLNPLRGRVGA